MGERQWSIADRFVYVMSQIQTMDDDVDNDNPHRYPLRKMKLTAEKIIYEALTTAQEVVDTAKVLKDEIAKVGADICATGIRELEVK